MRLWAVVVDAAAAAAEGERGGSGDSGDGNGGDSAAVIANRRRFRSAGNCSLVGYEVERKFEIATGVYDDDDDENDDDDFVFALSGLKYLLCFWMSLSGHLVVQLEIVLAECFVIVVFAVPDVVVV